MHAFIVANLRPNIHFRASNLHVPVGTSFGVLGNCRSFSEIHWEVAFLGDDDFYGPFQFKGVWHYIQVVTLYVLWKLQWEVDFSGSVFYLVPFKKKSIYKLKLHLALKVLSYRDTGGCLSKHSAI